MLILLHLFFLVLTYRGVTMIPVSTSVLDIKYSVYYLQAYCLPLCPCTGAYLPGEALPGWEVILGNSDWVHLEILLVENMKVFFFLELKTWILRGKMSQESFTFRYQAIEKTPQTHVGEKRRPFSRRTWAEWNPSHSGSNRSRGKWGWKAKTPIFTVKISAQPDEKS